jgi:polyisoprenyl-teichoic acid--peptidoglycan teichoic acid transferase
MSVPRRGRLTVVIIIPTLILVIAGLIAACVANTPLPLGSTSPSPSSRPTNSPTPEATATPTPQPTPDPVLLRKRITVLVLGSDSDPGRAARSPFYRTDTIMLVSIDAAHKQLTMVSLPRDVVDVPLGNGGVWRQKVNGLAYALGEKAMKRAMAATFGVPIDYYVEINMSDFALLVRSIGGIDLVVPYRLYDPPISLNLQPGEQHLNMNQALSYVRSRHTTSDYARDSRQQQVLITILRKIVDPGTQINFLDLLAAMRSLKTDLPLSQFPALFELARRTAHAKLVTRVLAPPTFATFAGIDPGGRGWIQEPNLRAIRAYVASVIRP